MSERLASPESEDERQWLEEREREEADRREDEERWAWEAIHDPTSDAYYSDGAREMRIDAELETP
jgi:hypothetical protein